MFKIPENKLPASLKDEQRLNVLFAPLRSKSVNPRDWEDKIDTWKIIIKLYCECNDVYCFNLSTLNNIFIRHGRPPSCLKEVVNDMIYNCEVQLVDVFLRKSPDSWSGWTTEYLLKRPISWSFNKLKKSIFTVNDMNNSYVHLDVIKEKCESLVSKIPDNFKNKLHSLRDLLTVLNKDTSFTQNTKLLLHHLENQKKVHVTSLINTSSSSELDTLLLKFSDGCKPLSISDVDIGIYTLEKNEKLLSSHVETLEDEIQNCVEEAKAQLKKNHRETAKTVLKKKHDLEKRLKKKANALHNVQTLLEQIKDTHTDAHVWEAYKNALSSFDTTFKDTGLNEDAIEDTMIQLGDVLEMHEGIQSALARPALDEDTSSLEEELAELMKEDDNNIQPPPDDDDDSGIADDVQRQLEKLSLLDLPEVPTHTPDTSLKETSAN